MSLRIIIIIITLFKSQTILAEHECSTNWGDCKSNKSNQMLVFEERENGSTRRKTSRSKVENQQKLNPHMTPGPGIEPGTHWWKASALNTAPILLSPVCFLTHSGCYGKPTRSIIRIQADTKSSSCRVGIRTKISNSRKQPIKLLITFLSGSSKTDRP